MITLTNNIRKIIFSLDRLKARREYSLFVAEGDKCVKDTITHFEIEYLVATSSWIDANHNLVELYNSKLCEVTRKDIERLTHLITPPDVLAVYRIPYNINEEAFFTDGISIALDTIQDPGNLGTIIRTADWFGVTNIYCSKETVDAYSPKVVQATMGAISRVKLYYCDLVEFVGRLSVPVYGTFLDGKNIYEADLQSEGLIIMGNEGKGISHELSKRVSHRLFIPSFPPYRITSESLNVATATAITLSEFRRRSYINLN